MAFGQQAGNQSPFSFKRIMMPFKKKKILHHFFSEEKGKYQHNGCCSEQSGLTPGWRDPAVIHLHECRCAFALVSPETWLKHGWWQCSSSVPPLHHGPTPRLDQEWRENFPPGGETSAQTRRWWRASPGTEGFHHCLDSWFVWERKGIQNTWMLPSTITRGTPRTLRGFKGSGGCTYWGN